MSAPRSVPTMARWCHGAPGPSGALALRPCGERRSAAPRRSGHGTSGAARQSLPPTDRPETRDTGRSQEDRRYAFDQPSRRRPDRRTPPGRGDCGPRSGLRRAHRSQWGRQPAPDDDVRRIPRRGGALHHLVRVRRWRWRLRQSHATPRGTDECREGRRLDAPAAAPRDRPGPGAGALLASTRPPRRRPPRSSWKSRSTRSTSRSCAAAPTRSASGPRTTASASRRTRPRSSSSTRPAARSSWLPPSMAKRPRRVARTSATARRSTSRSRPRTPGCRCASWPSARAAREVVEADVYLLNDLKPAMLPAPDGFNGMSLDYSQPASESLLADLRSDRGMEWVPAARMAVQGRARRRGRPVRVRPGDRCLRCRSAVPRRRRTRPAGRQRPDRAGDASHARDDDVRHRLARCDHRAGHPSTV